MPPRHYRAPEARLGRAEELSALQRLDQQARQLERCAQDTSFEAVIDEEFRRSPSYEEDRCLVSSSLRFLRLLPLFPGKEVALRRLV